MFDRIAGRYELLNALMSAGLNRIWNKKAVEATRLKPGERALDLACGTGSLTRDLVKRVGSGGYVLGMDFSKEMIQAAKKRPVPNVEYRLGDATDLEGAIRGDGAGGQAGRKGGMPGDSAARRTFLRRLLRVVVRPAGAVAWRQSLGRRLGLLVSARISERVRSIR
jgi:SAM-dependent methyltransferase